jgi:hypothetical protein
MRNKQDFLLEFLWVYTNRMQKKLKNPKKSFYG